MSTSKKYKENLKVLAHALSSVLNMYPDGFIIGDLDGYIIEVNEAILRMYGSGSNKEDFVGKHVTDFLVEKDRDRAARDSLDLLLSDESKTAEYRVISKSKQIVHVEVSILFVKDELGKKIGFIDLVRILSDTKKSAKS